MSRKKRAGRKSKNKGHNPGAHSNSPSPSQSSDAGSQAGAPDDEAHLLAKRSEYSGPIPPPDQLREFEQVCPGAAQTLIDNYRAESEHRREIERQAIEVQRRELEQDRKERTTGQWMGFVLVPLVLVAVVLLGWMGESKAAIALATIGIGTILGALIAGKYLGPKTSG